MPGRYFQYNSSPEVTTCFAIHALISTVQVGLCREDLEVEGREGRVTYSLTLMCAASPCLQRYCKQHTTLHLPASNSCPQFVAQHPTSLLSVYHSPSQDCVWQRHQLSLASAGPHHRHRARLLHLGRDQPHQPPQERHHQHQRAPGGRGHRAGQGAGAEGAGAGGGKWWSRSSRG